MTDVIVGGKEATVTIGNHTVTVTYKPLDAGDGQDSEDDIDTCLFEQDYTVAASTGFLIWEGCWVLIELLRGNLAARIRGKRVLELGAGTGLAGICAASV